MSTTISPAPVTPPPRLGPTPHVEEPETEQPESRWAIALRWAGDGLCIALLMAVLWWLSWHDGGREWTANAQVGLLALATVPFTVSELTRLPRPGRWAIALWPIGLALAIGLGQDRTGFSQPLVTYSMVPVVGLAAHRLWRRRWGPVAVLAVLMLAFGQYWYRSFMQWWGYAMWEGHALEWQPLSWHNQSGTLMGAFGLLFAGLALTGRRVLSWVGVLLAGAGLAGLWLSTSRGALVATVVGLVVMVVIVAIRRGWWRTIRATVTVFVVAAVVTGSLLMMGSQRLGGGESVTARNQTAGTSLLLRLDHWEAAFGMFVDDPLTGQGLGSYRRMALPWTPPDGTLTAHPHNVYLNVLAEGGLALALPFFVLAAAAGIVGVRRLRSDPDRASSEPNGDVGPEDVRWPLSLGAGGTVIMLLSHQGADFDWTFPVLPALLAVTVGVLAVDVAGRYGARLARSRRLLAVLTAALLFVVLGSGIVATFWENRARAEQGELSAEAYAARPTAWQGELASSVAEDLSRSGRGDLALEVLDRAIAWNPGSDELRVDRGIVLHRLGRFEDRELVDLALEAPWEFASLNEVAQELLDADNPELAQAVLRPMLEVYPAYERWGIDRNRSDTWYLLVRAAALQDGCNGAEEAAAQAWDADGIDEPEEIEPIEALVEDACQ